VLVNVSKIQMYVNINWRELIIYIQVMERGSAVFLDDF